MTKEYGPAWTLEQLAPFGLAVRSELTGASLEEIPVALLKEWVAEHRVVVLRGFASLAGNALPEFCHRLGEILEWEFGAVNELSVRSDAANYLYTNRTVPFHWDGAFAGRVPHYIFFHCDTAPPNDSGGETLFCNTLRVLERATPEDRELWERVTITYSTEKIAHYGGTFTSALMTQHPLSGQSVIRFAEPVEDLNPVHLEINGLANEKREAFLADMHRRLNDESVCYAHRWSDGDVVIADNLVLLHGRRAFEHSARRHIRRVNIL